MGSSSPQTGPEVVDRDQITDITTTLVRCALSDAEMASLPAPKGTEVLRPDLAHDEGHSLSAWWARPSSAGTEANRLTVGTSLVVTPAGSDVVGPR